MRLEIWQEFRTERLVITERLVTYREKHVYNREKHIIKRKGKYIRSYYGSH